MGTLVYFIKETFRGFLHAKVMTFVSIVTIAITLFFLGCVVLSFMNVRHWLDDASSQAGVVVYLADSVGNDTKKSHEMLSAIAALSSVDSVFLVDKDEAWRRFEQLYGKQMLDAVNENPLPASIEITLKQQYVYGEKSSDVFKSELEQIAGIDGVQFSQEWLSALRKFNSTFFWIGIVIIPLLLLALHFMIANTVKLTIYARKELITNMHFVGATDLYIKTPFVMEGILQGMIGGCIAVTGLYMLKLFLYHFSLYWGEWYFSPGIFSIGVLFGWIGSMSAVRRFLA